MRNIGRAEWYGGSIVGSESLTPRERHYTGGFATNTVKLVPNIWTEIKC